MSAAQRGVRELLNDNAARAGGLARAVYGHPLIYGLYATEYTPGASTSRPPVFARGRGLPSYIPSRNFALALLDLAARGPVPDGAVRLNMRSLHNPAVERVVLNALDTAGGDLGRAVAAIAAWYDSGMDRVSGWYRRSTQYVVFGVGLALAVALNVDAVAVARYLARHEAARGALVAQAARAARAAGDTLTLRQTDEQTRRDLAALELPIGWPRAAAGAPAPWYAAVPGWLVTALAATLGAPFWFDVLNKVIVVRSTVKPHEKSPEEASEDRQSPPVAPSVAARAVRLRRRRYAGGSSAAAAERSTTLIHTERVIRE